MFRVAEMWEPVHPQAVAMPQQSKVQSLAMLKSSASSEDTGPAYTTWAQAVAGEGDKAKLVMLQSQFDDYVKDYKTLDAGVQYQAAINA